VLVAALAGIGAAALVAVLFAAAVSLVMRALAGRWLARRFFARSAAVAAVGVAATCSVARAVDEPRTRVGCAGFRFDGADWRSPAAMTRVQTAEALDRCGSLDGATAAEVRRMLGPPSVQQRLRLPGGADASWSYAVGPAADAGGYALGLELRSGRVRRTEFQVFCC
jgi:hypothetical protein